MAEKGKGTVKTRMRALLSSIDYDFSYFTLDDFAHWLGQRRGRPIVFVPRPMPATVFGAWLAGKDRDFVFYDMNTPPLHQVHIQLHELAHMLCQHPTMQVNAGQAQVLLRGTNVTDAVATESVLLRSTRSNEIEQEAETLTDMIQERIMRHAELEALISATASNRSLADYMKEMDI